MVRQARWFFLLGLAGLPLASASDALDSPLLLVEAPDVGLDASIPTADVAISTVVDLPVAEGLGLGLPFVGITIEAPHSAAADAPPEDAAPSSGSAAWRAIPPEVAAPAAGGLAALSLALWALARAGLISLAGIPFASRLFSRIDGDRLLEHPQRARLNDLVASTPGRSLQDLQLASGIAWGTAVHHLRRLEHHGLVVSLRQSGHRRYFPANTESSHHKAGIAALTQETTLRIARLVAARPGIAQGIVCAELGLQAPSASKHLAQLAAVGLVAVTRDGRQRRYQPTTNLSSALRLGMAAV